MLMRCKVIGEAISWTVAIVSIEIATQILLPVLLGGQQSGHLYRGVRVRACVFPTVVWLNQPQILSTVLPRISSCLHNISCLACGVKGHTVNWGWILALSLVWFVAKWTNQVNRKQAVYVRNTQSTHWDCRVGVVQGSLLGSVIFILSFITIPNVCGYF